MNLNGWTLRLALAAAVLAAATAAPASETAGPAASRVDTIRTRGVLGLGVRDNAPPFSFRLADGSAVGYSVDVCRRIASALRQKWKLPALHEEWVTLGSVPAALEALRDGTIDLECGVTVDTEERRKLVDFAPPHFYSFVAVLVPARLEGRALAELGTISVAVPRGTVAARVLAARRSAGLAFVDLREADNAAAGLALLESGRVQAFANFEAQLLLWRSQQPRPADWALAANRLHLEPVALALPRHDAAWRQAVDAVLIPLMQDGELATLYARWFEQPIPPRGLTVGLPMSQLLRDSLRYPLRSP